MHRAFGGGLFIVMHVPFVQHFMQLILLELPFGDSPDRVSVQKWHSMLTMDYLRPVLPADPAVLTPRLKKAIEQGWLSYPSMRPTADDILSAVDDCVQQQLAAAMLARENGNRSIVSNSTGRNFSLESSSSNV